MMLENRNPLVRNRLRFIRSLGAAPFIDFVSEARNNGVSIEDTAQWLQLYMIGGVELLVNASIKDPIVTGMPLSYSTLSRYAPWERLNQFNASLTSGFGTLFEVEFVSGFLQVKAKGKPKGQEPLAAKIVQIA